MVSFYDKSQRRWVTGMVAKKPSEDARDWHIEHRIPLSRGGTDAFKNLWPACAFCNRSKHNRTVAEFKNDRQAPTDDLYECESLCEPFQCT